MIERAGWPVKIPLDFDDSHSNLKISLPQPSQIGHIRMSGHPIGSQHKSLNNHKPSPWKQSRGALMKHTHHTVRLSIVATI
jgi:hypothetical protein